MRARRTPYPASVAGEVSDEDVRSPSASRRTVDDGRLSGTV
jgi:hypothetical protein